MLNLSKNAHRSSLAWKHAFISQRFSALSRYSTQEVPDCPNDADSYGLTRDEEGVSSKTRGLGRTGQGIGRLVMRTSLRASFKPPSNPAAATSDDASQVDGTTHAAQVATTDDVDQTLRVAPTTITDNSNETTRTSGCSTTSATVGDAYHETAHVSIPLTPAQVATPINAPRVTIPRRYPVEAFKPGLERMLAEQPLFDLKTIFKRIRMLSSPDFRAYEVAANCLMDLKRSDDAATILKKMEKEGFLVSNPMRAKVMALILGNAPPNKAVIRDLVYNICAIVGNEEYDENQFLELLRIMNLYDVDRLLVGVVVSYFRDIQNRRRALVPEAAPYTPHLELVPEYVEILAREGHLDQALQMLEDVEPRTRPGERRTIGIAYTNLLSVVKEAYPWQPDVVARIKQGVERHGLPLQVPTTLLLGWAVKTEKYNDVAQLYEHIQEDLTLDAYVFHAMFKMHHTFNYSPKNIRMAPLAPRTLFRNMTRTAKSSTMLPDTVLLNTALGAFMHRRDFAATHAALDTYATYGAPLDNATFYHVVQSLVRRLWSDLLSKRCISVGQTKWGDHFLGMHFGLVKPSPAVVVRMLDQVSRRAFRVQDPLGALPSAEIAQRSRSSAGRRVQVDWSTVPVRERLEERWGPVEFTVPSMETMETVHPDPPTIVYDATPLQRLLHRAIVAERMLAGEDLEPAVRMSEKDIAKARLEMTGDGESG